MIAQITEIIILEQELLQIPPKTCALQLDPCLAICPST